MLYDCVAATSFGMQKSTRTTLFFSLSALFIIAAPAIIAYSQGYRVDLDNKKLVKTGAIFLEPRPAPVELFINGKLEKESNFIFQNIFVGDLLPRTYFIEVKKEGYFAWRKALVVKEKLVTEAKNIMLFPESSEQEEIKTDIKSFSPESTSMSLIELGNFPRIILYNKKEKDTLILNNLISESIDSLRWNKDLTKLIFNTGSRWILADVKDSKKPTDISREIASNDDFLDYTISLYAPKIDNLKWGEDNNTLFFMARDARALKRKVNILFAYNIEDKKISSPLSYNVLNYGIGAGKLVYVSSILGDVHSIDLGRRTTRPITSSSITQSEKDLVDLIITGEDKIIALVYGGIRDASSKDVYVYDKETSQFKKISDEDGAQDAIMSQDKKKVLIIGRNTISVYWLEEVHIQPFREAGDREEIYKSNYNILSADWFTKDNEHIFFSTKDGVSVIELDGRDKHNMHQISELPAQEMHYDKETNTLYILSDNTFYSISLN